MSILKNWKTPGMIVDIRNFNPGNPSSLASRLPFRKNSFSRSVSESTSTPNEIEVITSLPSLEYKSRSSIVIGFSCDITRSRCIASPTLFDSSPNMFRILLPVKAGLNPGL
uniref:Uncharacterized protein n=1 Tax=Anopheles atroparvus TaxID=41427 RepID=A0AAG5CV53_ANOAO